MGGVAAGSFTRSAGLPVGAVLSILSILSRSRKDSNRIHDAVLFPGSPTPSTNVRGMAEEHAHDRIISGRWR